MTLTVAVTFVNSENNKCMIVPQVSCETSVSGEISFANSYLY